MLDVSRMPRRLAMTFRRPPAVVRWVLAAIFAAAALIALTESFVWLAFAVQYARVPALLISGLLHLFVYAFLTAIAGAIAPATVPRGPRAFADPLANVPDEETTRDGALGARLGVRARCAERTKPPRDSATASDGVRCAGSG